MIVLRLLRRFVNQTPISPLAAFKLKRSQYFPTRLLTLASSSLSQAQQNRISLLVQATLELSEEEQQIANRRYRDNCEQILGVDVALFSDFSPKLERKADGSWPELKDENLEVLRYMGKAAAIPGGVVDGVAQGWKIPLMSQGTGSAPGKTDSAAAKPVTAAPIEEKTTFNLVLVSFPADAKIKLIKEVKNLLNIGLKEAKDQVESVAKQPLVLYKHIAKADAEAKMKKLTDAGGIAELQ